MQQKGRSAVFRGPCFGHCPYCGDFCGPHVEDRPPFSNSSFKRECPQCRLTIVPGCFRKTVGKIRTSVAIGRTGAALFCKSRNLRAAGLAICLPTLVREMSILTKIKIHERPLMKPGGSATMDIGPELRKEQPRMLPANENVPRPAMTAEQCDALAERIATVLRERRRIGEERRRQERECRLRNSECAAARYRARRRPLPPACRTFELVA